MSESGSRGGGVSPFWILLLLPAGLLAGVVIGRLPTPTPTLARQDPVLPARTQTPSAGIEVRTIVTQPATEPAPEPQGTSDERSSWTTLSSAIEESNRNGKPILLDFNAEWCPPCRAMKREVFDDQGRGEAVQKAVIPVSIVDRRREDGSNPPETENLQQKYRIDAFPTLVVYSPRSGRVETARGYGDPDRVLEWITRAAQAVR